MQKKYIDKRIKVKLDIKMVELLKNVNAEYGIHYLTRSTKISQPTLYRIMNGKKNEVMIGINTRLNNFVKKHKYIIETLNFNEGSYYLDMTGWLDRETMEMLKNIARIEERTVKAQAKYILKKEIKKYPETHYNQLFLIKKEIK